MKETIEHNNRFYGEELKTESEQLKEWLVIANKEIERLNNIIKNGINEELTKELNEILKCNQRQANRIHEAIEYIEEHTTHYTSYLGKEHKVLPKIELQREAYDKLLEILKGSDKE